MINNKKVFKYKKAIPSMFNKRGQELSTGTIILLIIGVIILVLLALGFTSGWSKLFPFLTKTNVEQVRTSCSAVCTEGAQEAYCLTPRDVYSEEGKKYKGISCYALAVNGLYNIQGCGIDCGDKLVIVTNEDYSIKGPSDTKLTDVCKDKIAGTIVQTIFNETKSLNSFKIISHTCLAAETTDLTDK